MSAWVVSDRHIDVLVTLGFQHMRHYTEGHSRTTLGTMLREENIASVCCRYPEERPGLPGAESHGMIPTNVYEYTPIPYGLITRVEGLMAIHCYEYQSCEHDGWETSAAKKFCDRLESALVRSLPGYDDAPWGFEESDILDRMKIAGLA